MRIIYIENTVLEVFKEPSIVCIINLWLTLQ